MEYQAELVPFGMEGSLVVPHPLHLYNHDLYWCDLPTLFFPICCY